jgi:hypothetical protein
MPDPVQLLTAGGAAGVAAFLVMFACGWLWRNPTSPGRSAGGLLAVAAGFAAGCYVLRPDLHLDLRDVEDRLLLVLLPAALAVEVLAVLATLSGGGAASEFANATGRGNQVQERQGVGGEGFAARGTSEFATLPTHPGAPPGTTGQTPDGPARPLKPLRWLVMALRVLLAAVAAPVLFYKTTFLAGLTGPGKGEWDPQQTYLVLAILALSLAAVWVILARLGERSEGPGPLLALAVVCAAAGPAVMITGYIGAGKLAVPLAGALGGAGLALMAVPGRARTDNLLGLGAVGLFSVLCLGRFFGNLPTWIALVLFAVPLLAWLPAIPWLRAWKPWLRAALCLLVVSVPAAVAVQQAFRAAQEEARQNAPAEGEPSVDDYMNFKP